MQMKHCSLADYADFWRRYRPNSGLLVHPDDRAALVDPKNKKYVKNGHSDFRAYCSASDFGDWEDSRLDLSLAPLPFCGNIRSPKVVVLMLNPGLSYVDYFAELSHPDFKNVLDKNIRGEYLDSEQFPFFWLNPNFCWHSGFKYWEEKLRNVIRKIADQLFVGSYFRALEFVSKHLALLELVPYHSTKFSSHTLIDQLESAKQARKFLHSYLIPRALAGETTIIATRQVKVWDLPENNQNIITYDAFQARGANLGPDTAGGKAILAKLIS